MTSPAAPYVLGSTDAEHERLIRQAARLDPFTERLFRDAGIRPGQRVHARRLECGERPVGRKIGFTNRTIWAEYGVRAPIWSHVYDSTVHHVPDGRCRRCFCPAVE